MTYKQFPVIDPVATGENIVQLRRERGLSVRDLQAYRRENGKLAIVPEEAEIVRSIFDDYLAGKGVTAIAKRLNESGYATQSGCVFHKGAVERILRNYAYTGNLLLQTKFRENHLTKVTRKNQGELPWYHASDTHETIIPLETFNAVQAEIRRRVDAKRPI